MDRERFEDGGLLFAVGDGVLTARDPGSGRVAGPPIPLGDTEQQIRFHRSFPHVRARPGHPGQVAVLSNVDVKLWDAVHGRLIATLPARANIEAAIAARSAFAFDSTGTRLAVLARDPAAVQPWDVDTAGLARAPIPAPNATEVLGFDADGYLDVINKSGTSARVFTIDLDSGAESGGLDQQFGSFLDDDRRTVSQRDLDTATLSAVPVTAQAWRDALCAVVNRLFTPTERDALPPGASGDPPC
jgi:hypothetical protein